MLFSCAKVAIVGTTKPIAKPARISSKRIFIVSSPVECGESQSINWHRQCESSRYQRLEHKSPQRDPSHADDSEQIPKSRICRCRSDIPERAVERLLGWLR